MIARGRLLADARLVWGQRRLNPLGWWRGARYCLSAVRELKAQAEKEILGG
jgi:hypothetical protein